MVTCENCSFFIKFPHLCYIVYFFRFCKQGTLQFCIIKPLTSFLVIILQVSWISVKQWCGCGSGIRWIFDLWIRDPGWVIKIKIRIRDKHPGSYFLEFRNKFWVKILKFFDADADPGSGNLFALDSGSGMEKIPIRDPEWKKFRSWIRDKHLGSATLQSINHFLCRVVTPVGMTFHRYGNLFF